MQFKEEVLNPTPIEGDLRIVYIPQVPMNGYTVDITRHRGEVDSAYLERAAFVLNAVVGLSIFEFENQIKPDYSDFACILRWEKGEWCDVDEEEYEGV